MPGTYFAPVAATAGDIVGAIRCTVDGGGVIGCETGADTDGDGRPNLVIHPDQAGICTP